MTNLRHHAMSGLILGGCGLSVGACDPLDQVVDLERMIAQPYAQPYEASPYFEDGRVLRHPPAGTVARGQIVGAPLLTEGMENERYAERIPIPLSRATLEKGRANFDIFCATCHGLLGNGESIPADFMTFRRPPSLIDPPISNYPPGRSYRAIAEGYGLMPSYAWLLGVEQRWAVVGYMEAFTLNQRAELDSLPPSIRTQVEHALP